jgi:RecJ-like exonuclease
MKAKDLILTSEKLNKYYSHAPSTSCRVCGAGIVMLDGLPKCSASGSQYVIREYGMSELHHDAVCSNCRGKNEIVTELCHLIHAKSQSIEKAWSASLRERVILLLSILCTSEDLDVRRYCESISFVFREQLNGR